MISEFPLFLFTTLAGLGGGAYALSAVFPTGKDAKRAWLFPLVCLVLLGVGLIGLPLHLGHPERMFIALTQPGAMIAQEAYWSIALGIILLVDVVLCKTKGAAPRALRAVGAIAALGLMFVMANAYFASKAIAAWASWQTFPLFILGDLAMGAALLALFDADLAKDAKFVLVAAVLSALEAVHFAGVGADMILLAIGAVAAVVAAIVQFVAKSGKIAPRTAAIAAFVCVFVGVALSRYGFYAACVL